MASLRTSLSPSAFALHSRQFQRFLALPAGIRYASSAPPPKPRLLEKPDRFNPPSHPSRLRSKHRSYGAPLSDHERKAQKTRSYPHMMPAEGTFTHWFLTNKSIHLWISIGILVMLTGGIWIGDFLHSTPYMDLLPPNSMFFAHPLTFMGRYIEVYQMHSEHVTAQTAEMRRQKVEDVKRRSEYRKAHGLEDEDESRFGGWTAKSDSEVLGPTPVTREGGQLPAAVESSIAMDLAQSTETKVPAAKQEPDVYVDFEGKTQPAQKKWFGIW